MKSSRKKRIPQPVSAPPSLKSRWQAWFASKSAVLLFCGKFMLLMLAYFAVSMMPFFHSVMDGYLTGIARLSSILLNTIGEANQITGVTIWSQKYAITVLPFCAATEFMWFFCAAVISFPATWVQRVVGAMVGVLLLLVLNLVRIASLYYVGVHFRSSFDTIHEEIWPTVFIVATIFIGSGWIKWVRGGNQEETHAPA